MLQRCAALIAAAGLALVTVACAQTDAGITTNVKTKLAADDTVKAYQMDVDTRNGVVTLTGEVESAAEKEVAIRIARDTEGVRDVIDQIRIGEAAPTAGIDNDPDTDRDISGTLRNEGQQAGQAVSDAAITTTVKSKFLADDTVKGLSIDVDTDNGVVTLTGNVSSRAEADRAMMLARQTEGVSRVVDNLKVGRS
jgi:hyperosmotically inducible protein